MLDIDNFKKYNDHYGHQSGDDCLRSVAHAIEAAVQRSNGLKHTELAFAARYGGEEFAVVVPQARVESLMLLAHSIVQAVRGLAIAHTENANWERVTISVGGARVSPAAGEVVALFRAADSRLYLAKEQGRNRAVVSDPVPAG